MRKVFAVVLIAVMAGGVPVVAAAKAAAPQAATGGVQGTARDAQQQPLTHHTVQVRNVATGQLVGTATTSASGEFTFSGLPAGNYVIEVVNAAGQIVGTSTPIAVSGGAVSTVTVASSATGALAGNGAGFRLFGLNTVGTLAVLGGAAAGVTALIVTRDDKITICHKPAGTPAQTIEISENARDSHLAHGDTTGACPASPAR